MKEEDRMEKALGAEVATPQPIVDKIKVLKIKGVEYLRRVQPNSSGTIFQLFALYDKEYRKPLGEVETDPVLGKYIRLHFYA